MSEQIFKQVITPEGEQLIEMAQAEIDENAAPAETVEQTIARYEKVLDDHPDSVARAHRYENRITFAIRSGYPNPWREEGTAFGIWMDTCNAQALALLNDVLAGLAELPPPTEFIAALPVFEFPE